MRHEQEEKNLAELTGWDEDAIAQKMNPEKAQYIESGGKKPAKNQWWRSIWK